MRLLPGSGHGLDRYDCRSWGTGQRRQEQVEQAVFGGELGLVLDLFHFFFADHVDGDLDEVADDGFDVATDVADLGELRGLDLEEGRVGELGEATGDLGFADAGRARS